MIFQDNNKLSCEKCNFNFNDEDEVSKHIIETHEKNKKDAFIKECSEMVTKHMEYKSWEEEIAHIPGVTFVSQEEANLFAITKIANLQTYKETSQSSQKPILKLKNYEPTDTQSDTFRIVRERSAGPNIYEAERTVFTPQDDGTLKKNCHKRCFC